MDDVRRAEVLSAKNFNLNDLFASILLGDIPPPPRGLITVKKSISIAATMSILHRNQINAVPVMDDSAVGTEMFLGIVDVARVTEFVLSEAAKTSMPLQNLSAVLEEMDVFSETPISKLLPLVPFEPFTPLKTSNTLLHAMLVMGKFHLQRIPIVDCFGRLVNFVTQRGMLRHVNDLCQSGLVDMNVPVNLLGLPSSRKVAAVNQNEPVINAFKLMAEKWTLAVPVVNEYFEIVGNLSATDVHHFVVHPNSFVRACRSSFTVREFLRSYLEQSPEKVTHSVTCKETDSLTTVMARMMRPDVREVFVVDSNNRPQAVINVGDLISVMVMAPKGFLESANLGLTD